MRKKAALSSALSLILAGLSLTPRDAAASHATRGAQSDQRRQTVAVTYPLEQTVNLRFRGTTQFPRLSAEAKVRRVGRRDTRVELEVENLPHAFELGGVFTTYVLWAITPEGRADNLGELLRGKSSSEPARLAAATPLETFALIVTAEPHYLVRAPSRMVVLENLPPGKQGDAQLAEAPTVYLGSTSEYFSNPRVPDLPDREAYMRTPVSLLGARQAVSLARDAGAERDATSELTEARTALERAEQAHRLGQPEDNVDKLARIAILLGATAEEVAEQRAAARKRREEIARSDPSVREAGDAELATQVRELRAELDRERAARELAERKALLIDRALVEDQPYRLNHLIEPYLFNSIINPDFLSPVNRQLLYNTVRRYPTIEAPAEVKPEVVFIVQVSLTEELQTREVKVTSGARTPDGKVEAKLPANPPSGAWDIVVVLSADGFEIVEGAHGSNQAVIKLPQIGDSTSAMFKLRAGKGGAGRESRKVFATFWHKGQFIAKAVREVTVVSGGAATRPDADGRARADAEAEARAEESAPPAELREAEASPAEKMRTQSDALSTPAPVQVGQMSFNVGGAPAGLSGAATRPPPKLRNFVSASPLERNVTMKRAAVISEQEQGADLILYMFGVGPGVGSLVISGRTLQPTHHSYTPPHDLAGWLESYYRRLNQPGVRDANSEGGAAAPDPGLARGLLRDFGRELYLKYAPPAFREAFWKLADSPKNDFKSIQIYSDDPALPWELMIPVRRDGRGERGHLGIEFNVSRWHVTHNTAIPDRPPSSLRLNGLVALAPDYTKVGRVLPHQAEELEMLKAHGFEHVSARVRDIKTLARLLPQGIVHFAGHGNFSEPVKGVAAYSISLEDGDLDPETWRGLVLDKERTHPVFFFNACSVGRAQRVANFVNGWAPAVLEAGASGFIGALWPVEDASAAAFSRQFYDNLAAALARGPTTLGDVLKETRQNFIKNGDRTYLAYVLYGDVNLTLEGR